MTLPCKNSDFCGAIISLASHLFPSVVEIMTRSAGPDINRESEKETVWPPGQRNPDVTTYSHRFGEAQSVRLCFRLVQYYDALSFAGSSLVFQRRV
jgi:hypothetical protein